LSLFAMFDEPAVYLSWNPTTGATAYTIKRATVSGGPYTTIGTSATTLFTDSTAAYGTAYFYVVTATVAGSPTANSTEVSATPAFSFASYAPVSTVSFAPGASTAPPVSGPPTGLGFVSAWMQYGINWKTFQTVGGHDLLQPVFLAIAVSSGQFERGQHHLCNQLSRRLVLW
jgi:hypothetical protein